ncbi:MAG: hypothetical protein OXE78_08950 [Gammaproteobacteria bacterium]|nr:hypothetical protein [Gammaproteobacteria bacterium]
MQPILLYQIVEAITCPLITEYLRLFLGMICCLWVFMDPNWHEVIIVFRDGTLIKEPQFSLDQNLVQIIAETNEFKVEWKILKNISNEQLHRLSMVAMIESIGSSIRIEGSRLSNT